MSYASRLGSVKEFIVDIWEHKSKYYGDSPCTQQPSPQSPAGDLEDFAKVIRRKGKCRCWAQVSWMIVYVYVAPPLIMGAWSMA